MPLPGDIPWVGEAFTNRRESTKKVGAGDPAKPTVVEGYLAAGAATLLRAARQMVSAQGLSHEPACGLALPLRPVARCRDRPPEAGDDSCT